MIDARGYSCPTPVVMVHAEVKKTNAKNISVMVDNICAVENITRFAKNNGYSVKTTEQEDDFCLELTK